MAAPPPLVPPWTRNASAPSGWAFTLPLPRGPYDLLLLHAPTGPDAPPLPAFAQLGLDRIAADNALLLIAVPGAALSTALELGASFGRYAGVLLVDAQPRQRCDPITPQLAYTRASIVFFMCFVRGSGAQAVPDRVYGDLIFGDDGVPPAVPLSGRATGAVRDFTATALLCGAVPSARERHELPVAVLDDLFCGARRCELLGPTLRQGWDAWTYMDERAFADALAKMPNNVAGLMQAYEPTDEIAFLHLHAVPVPASMPQLGAPQPPVRPPRVSKMRRSRTQARAQI